MKTRLLIVDDSAFIRRMIQDWVESEPDFEVVGVGKNGDDAVRLCKELRPDVMTLDVEMPGRDGISALTEIMHESPTNVLMVSSVTIDGADLTVKALTIGAYDFVTKPGGSASFQFRGTREELLSKLRAFKSVRRSTTSHRIIPVRASGRSDKVVVIASSTGGPKHLNTLFSALPKGFPAPILIVQHMPVGFTASLAKRLDAIGNIPCKEAEVGDVIIPGLALLAPAGRHLLVGARGEIAFNDDASRHGVRPAADYLFESAARHYGSRLIGVVLTGMGHDGAAGALAIKKAGGTVFGESEESCVVYGMPKAAKAIGAVHGEFSIEEMGAAIAAELGGEKARAS